MFRLHNIILYSLQYYTNQLLLLSVHFFESLIKKKNVSNKDIDSIIQYIKYRYIWYLS